MPSCCVSIWRYWVRGSAAPLGDQPKTAGFRDCSGLSTSQSFHHSIICLVYGGAGALGRSVVSFMKSKQWVLYLSWPSRYSLYQTVNYSIRLIFVPYIIAVFLTLNDLVRLTDYKSDTKNSLDHHFCWSGRKCGRRLQHHSVYFR